MNIAMFPYLLFLLVKFAFAAPVETTEETPVIINGVVIEFDVNDNTFPESWKTEEINPLGVALDSVEKERSMQIIQKALRKYPLAVLSKNLKKIVVLKDMQFFGVGYGGTNSNDVVYITNDGIDQNYTDDYIEQIIHHEFSSILLRNHPEFFNEAAWTKSNGKEYGQGGEEAIKSETAGEDYDEELMKLGFLCQYAHSDVENDFNTFAQCIFRCGPEFWDYCDKYPPIDSKLSQIIQFYNKLNPKFSKKYFLSVSKQ